MSVMSEHYRELHRWMSLPHIWGESDCIIVLADWVLRVRGVDPAEAVRGTYCDPVSCQQVTGFLRAPVETAGRYLEAVGLTRGNALQIGDVAVIRRRDDPRWPCGAMWLGDCWGCKGPQGTTTLQPALVEVEAFWGVGYAA
tara:strand:+ start:2986 stop:3408 length:423 start_codon:yes stop_codon:yes gene_type:complete